MRSSRSLPPDSKTRCRSIEADSRAEETGSQPDAPARLAGGSVAAVTGMSLLERRYAIAAQYDAHGVVVFDADQRVVEANDRYSEIYGLDPSTAKVGVSLEEILAKRIEKGVYGSNGPAAYSRERLRGFSGRSTCIQDLIDGRSILIVRQRTNNGHWIATHEDITDRLRMEAEVAHLATSDPLTGLANRAALMTRLHEALCHLAGRDMACLMLIDLDHFKQVNDTHGHDIGDEVLKISAARICGHARDTDFVARLGGDEFVVLQAPVSDSTHVKPMATRLIDALSEPALTSIGEATIGATIGVSLAKGARTGSEELLKSADVALYAAKDAGRGTYRLSE